MRFVNILTLLSQWVKDFLDFKTFCKKLRILSEMETEFGENNIMELKVTKENHQEAICKNVV